jgi:hypothetical protein
LLDYHIGKQTSFGLLELGRDVLDDGLCLLRQSEHLPPSLVIVRTHPMLLPIQHIVHSDAPVDLDLFLLHQTRQAFEDELPQLTQSLDVMGVLP